MKKGILLVFLILIVAAGTVACSTATSSQTGQSTTTVTQTVTATPSGGSSTTSTGVIQLKFATGENDAHWRTAPMKAFAAELDQATNGITKTTIFTGGTLGAGQVLADNAAKDVVDMAFLPARAINANYVPAINLMGNSVFITDTDAMSYIMADLYARGLWSIPDLKVLMFTPTETGGQFYTKDRQINTVEDVKGLVVGGAAASADFVKALGATLVEAPPPEIYSDLDKGITNAQLVGAGLAMALKLDSVCKYVLWNNTSQDGQLCVINQKKYDSLPDSVKAALLGLSFKYTYIINAAANQNAIDSYNYFSKSGITINTLSQSEFQKMVDIVAPQRDALVKDMDAKGLHGTEILDIAKADLAALGNPTK